MIRPITVVSFALACASGLYLYQVSHRVHVLDTRIEKIVHETAATRERIRLLHAEWTLRNQPERLQQLVSQFLPELKPTNPNQFVSMAALDSRLPPVEVPAPPAQQPDQVPVAGSPAAPDASAAIAAAAGTATTPTDAAAAPPPVAVATQLPPPPPAPPPQVKIAAAVPRRVPAEPVHAPDARPADSHRPVTVALVAPRRPEPPAARPRITEAALVSPPHRRGWTPARLPYPGAALIPPAPTGSLLGMAHNAAATRTLPPPIPLPVPAGNN